MNKYHNGKIYKIADVGYNKCYIGSTTESLSRRMARHRSQYKKQEDMKGKVYSFELFDLYGTENCKIELIEKIICENKEELLKREGELIQSMDCVNKKVSGRTKQDWYNDNKKYCIEKSKRYYKDNSQKVAQYQKDKYERDKDVMLEKRKQNKIACDCGVVCRKTDIRRHEKSITHQEYLKSLEPTD